MLRATLFRSRQISAGAQASLDAAIKFLKGKRGACNSAELGRLRQKPPDGLSRHAFLQEHHDKVSIKQTREATPRPKHLSSDGLPEFHRYDIDQESELDQIVQAIEAQTIDREKGSLFVGLDISSEDGISLFLGASMFRFSGKNLTKDSIIRGLDKMWENSLVFVKDASSSPARDLRQPFENLKIVDPQIAGEMWFNEPYLDYDSLLNKLLVQCFGSERVPARFTGMEDNLFFYLLCGAAAEKYSLGDEQSKLFYFGHYRSMLGDDNDKYRVIFDPVEQYSMKSWWLAISEPKPEPKHEVVAHSHLNDDVDIDFILDILPERLRVPIEAHPFVPSKGKDSITELALDVGRRPQFWANGQRMFFEPNDVNYLVESDDIDHILRHNPFRFRDDNRASFPGQLHRISAIRNHADDIYGLTIRVGRHIKGTADLILDFLLGSKRSVLILGEPGSGKTTIIRECARMLSESREFFEGKNVFIIDTSNEIAGDGDIPHSCIGNARRMMVKSLEKQSSVMIECVQNQTPDVMVLDEIGRPKEVAAAATSKKRGVQLVASAHGDFRNLVDNAELVGLLGGVKLVTLGDEVASRIAENRKTGMNKVVAERIGAPTFDVVVEPWIGLNGLLERLALPTHPSKHLIQELDHMDQGGNFWTRRPIPKEYLEYAAFDVHLLLQTVSPLEDLLASQRSSLDDFIDPSLERAADAISKFR